MNTAPEDLEAEAHVLGACMYRSDLIEQVALVLDPSDFHDPKNGWAFQAIIDLWNAGEPVDAKTVSARLNGNGPSDQDLTRFVGGVPASAHAPKYARIIVEHRARRKLIDLAAEIVDQARNLLDPGEIVDSFRAALSSVQLPSGRVPTDLIRLDDLLDRPEADREPWVIPGLLRRDWRVIVVAPEGAGKTLLLQQVAVCAAQGVHPLTYRPIPAVRVLIVDLENPEERISHGCTPIRDRVRGKVTDYDPGRAMLWHRPGGIDLRTRATCSEFEAVLEHVRPNLVVMGPAYKASTRHKGEGWDEGAAQVQRVLDGFRTRFRFALLMEDHAPQSTGGVRDLRPFGSSLWLRWPEIGLKLTPQGDGPRVLDVKRWRGDRLPNEWPDRLEESSMWPWVGVWENGIPAERVA